MSSRILRILSCLVTVLWLGCRAAPVAPLAAPTEAESTIERLDPGNPVPGSIVYEVTVRDGVRSEVWRVTMAATPFRLPGAFRLGWEGLSAEQEARLPGAIQRDMTVVQVTVQRPGREDVVGGIGMPEFGVAGGLFGVDGARTALRSRATRPVDESTILSLCSSPTLFVVWSTSEAFAPLLKELVGPPPLGLAWKGLWNGGVDLNLGSPEVIGRGSFALGANGTVPSLRLKLQIEVLGEPAMELELEAVEAWSPLDLALGLVRVHGKSLLDPDRSIEIRLIGAAPSGPLTSGTIPVLRSLQLTLHGEALGDV